jgi:HK97 family phage major capsid protein
MRSIKVIKQEAADNQADIAKLEAEANVLLDIAAAERTPEQTTRLTDVRAKLKALDTVKASIAEDLATANRLANVERSDTTGRVEVGADRATMAPWGPAVAADAAPHRRLEAEHLALGNFALAVRAAGMGHGLDPRLQAAATGAGTQSDSNLGFAVPSEVAPGIERDMFAVGELLSRCDVRTISGNTIAYTLFDETSRADSSRGGGVLGYWVDEGTAPTASNMKLARMEMKLRKVGALGVMTDELLSDAVALGGELQSAFADELVFQTENKIYRGAGSSAPLGFLNAPCLVSVSKETNQAAVTINTTNLSKMWARMPARSKANAVWLINVDCEPQLDELAQAIGTGGTAPRFVT